MPRELSLNDPLSGFEIKEIAKQKFAQALERDCTLVNDLTYPGFVLKFDASISFVRSQTPPTALWGVETKGQTPTGVIQLDHASGDYQTDSPNTAREENNLPMPVMIQTPSGPKREKVQIQKS